MIDRSKNIQLGKIILIHYTLVSEVKRNHLARVIIDSCTLEHSDFPGTTFNLVENGQPILNAETSVIQFKLNQVCYLTTSDSSHYRCQGQIGLYYTFCLFQESPSISLLAFGNKEHEEGLTNFNIKCRLYLCMRKGDSQLTYDECLAARDRQRRDGRPETTTTESVLRNDHRPSHPKMSKVTMMAEAEIAKESKVVATQINVGGRLKSVNIVLLVLLGVLLIAIVVFVLVHLCCCRAKSVSPPATIDFVQVKLVI